MKKYIRNWSQSDKILKYMKNNHTESVEATTFMHWKNFVWYEASARLSELKSMWLIEKVWKIRNRNLYRLTTEWIEFITWIERQPKQLRCKITFNWWITTVDTRTKIKKLKDFIANLF
jgi:hypothetical protein